MRWAWAEKCTSNYEMNTQPGYFPFSIESDHPIATTANAPLKDMANNCIPSFGNVFDTTEG